MKNDKTLIVFYLNYVCLVVCNVCPDIDEIDRYFFATDGKINSNSACTCGDDGNILRSYVTPDEFECASSCIEEDTCGKYSFLSSRCVLYNSISTFVLFHDHHVTTTDNCCCRKRRVQYIHLRSRLYISDNSDEKKNEAAAHVLSQLMKVLILWILSSGGSIANYEDYYSVDISQTKRRPVSISTEEKEAGGNSRLSLELNPWQYRYRTALPDAGEDRRRLSFGSQTQEAQVECQSDEECEGKICNSVPLNANSQSSSSQLHESKMCNFCTSKTLGYIFNVNNQSDLPTDAQCVDRISLEPSGRTVLRDRPQVASVRKSDGLVLQMLVFVLFLGYSGSSMQYIRAALVKGVLMDYMYSRRAYKGLAVASLLLTTLQAASWSLARTDTIKRKGFLGALFATLYSFLTVILSLSAVMGWIMISIVLLSRGDAALSEQDSSGDGFYASTYIHEQLHPYREDQYNNRTFADFTDLASESQERPYIIPSFLSCIPGGNGSGWIEEPATNFMIRIVLSWTTLLVHVISASFTLGYKRLK